MSSDFQERVRIAIAKRNRDCPGLMIEENRKILTFSCGMSELVKRYSNRMEGRQSYQIGFPRTIKQVEDDPALFDHVVKNLSKEIFEWRETEANCKVLTSLDAFFNLTGQGTVETPIEIDRVFLNVLQRAGYSIEDILSAIRQELMHKGATHPRLVRDAVVSAFTNVNTHDLFSIFHSKYRNMHEISPRFGKALPFQLAVWGSHIMATDIRLAVGVHYRSSVTPTITLRGSDLPQSVIHTLKGEPINRVINEPLFNDTVKIRHVTKNNNVINIGIEADRVDITHLGWQSQPLKKAA